MPYLASVFFFFVSIVLLHLHIGTCFIVLVFSLSFLLVRDTALVMCIIFRSPQWCWRCRCPKKTKKKSLRYKSISHPSKHKRRVNKKVFFFLPVPRKITFNAFSFLWASRNRLRKVTSLCRIAPLTRWRRAVFVKGKFCSWWHFYTPTPFVDIWKNSCKVSKECEPPVAVSNKWHFVIRKSSQKQPHKVFCR